MAFKDFAMHEQIRRMLAGAEFPLSRDQILGMALDNNASADIVSLLERMPDRQYNDADDVIQGTREAQRAK